MENDDKNIFILIIILCYSDIIKGGLAACVNLVPNITSIYMWKGKINEELEQLMVKYILNKIK